MHRIIRALMMTFGVGLLNSYRKLSLDLLKIQAASAYLKGVQTVRRAWIAALLMAVVLLLLAAGFVMLHVGLFFWIPGTMATKAVVLMGLGLLYMAVALGVIIALCSEKAWLKSSHASQFIEEATRKP